MNIGVIWCFKLHSRADTEYQQLSKNQVQTKMLTLEMLARTIRKKKKDKNSKYVKLQQLEKKKQILLKFRLGLFKSLE